LNVLNGIAKDVLPLYGCSLHRSRLRDKVRQYVVQLVCLDGGTKEADMQKTRVPPMVPAG